MFFQINGVFFLLFGIELKEVMNFQKVVLFLL